MELMNKLIDAFADDRFEHRYYLDIETGAVEVDLDESLFVESEDPWDENENIERYLEIPKVQSSDFVLLMQQFAKLTGKDLPDDPESFKNELVELGLEDEWKAFELENFKEQLQDWLDVEELDYDELNKK